ncbi:MAG: cytochrome c3 family protein [Chromatiales bacterium]|jgi:hypothetical protein
MSIAKLKWLIWLVLTALAASALYAAISGHMDQSMLMPGPLSNGHHQLKDNCQTCHLDAFGGGEVLQKSCINCHGNDRKKPDDSHPMTKFRDPRNAELLEKINALQCITCHSEHRLEITRKDGLTQPVDFCVHCHSKIGDDRPSHQGMEFNSCKTSGCHNYHNNRAIYTDFLVKHLDEPALLARPKLKAREFGDIIEELADYPHGDYPVQELTPGDADYPQTLQPDDQIIKQWAATAHARSGVNCSACHNIAVNDASEKSWMDQPGTAGCTLCHGTEVDRFKLGKHGMRLASDLPAMQVSEARLPMHETAAHQQLQCNSCHADHDFNAQQAAVDACLNCHADEHSLAYQDSPHAKAWQAELDGTAKPDTGVSCASCHMPRINFDVNEWVSRIMVDHNQSANLSPNSKMVRQVCMNCHGLDFSLKAMADNQQINSNFAHSPDSKEHESMLLARRDHERYLRETSGMSE